MARYKFRYFFDPGSGICLWSANDLSKERFGYPVDINELSLPEHLYLQTAELLARFDTSVDWNDPAGPSPWSETERSLFNDSAQSLFIALRQQLGSEFEIIDESRSQRA